MLLVHLQEYDPRSLRELKDIVEDCLDWDWDARLKSCSATPDALLKQIAGAESPALFIMEDAKRGDLDEAVLAIREQNALHYLVLWLHSPQAALDVRPTYYRLSGFLARPVDKSSLRLLLEFIYRDFAASRVAYGGFFSLKIRGTTYQLPYEKILFFESRGKKTVARTEAQEYEFYDSMDEVDRAAPDFFLRSHRSYCVNLRQVVSANFAERTVTLSDGSVLPFSRTFKQELAEAMAGKSRGGMVT